MKAIITLLSCIVVLLVVSNVYAVDSWNVELVGRTLGPAHAVHVAGIMHTSAQAVSWSSSM